MLLVANLYTTHLKSVVLFPTYCFIDKTEHAKEKKQVPIHMVLKRKSLLGTCEKKKTSNPVQGFEIKSYLDHAKTKKKTSTHIYGVEKRILT